MSSTPFGEHLKREREMRGVSIEEVAAATRISTRFLEAIENERWESLPGGVFNRGFIRSIARYLGLDEDSMVAEYSLETKGKVDTGVVPDAPMDIPRNWKPAAVAIIVLIAVLGGATFVYARYGGRIAARLHGRRAATASTTAPAATAPSNDASSRAKDATRAIGTSGGATNSAQNPSAIPGGAAAAAADPLELKIQATRTLNVRIVADGKMVFDGTVEIGQAKQFEAQDALEITASDPSAAIFELEGRPVSAFGQPGLAGTIKLTRSDLKTPLGDSH